ncbi:MAG: 6-phosphofructokinase [Clostridiales Family XIII bacterium]|jgi:6-phosphofructokinase 1|nr:6-phosphofructokinase [Clostridiales Family XIII bacterium]
MAGKNMIIAQSGGPSSAINASVAGAVARAMADDKIDRVLGAINGMQGFLEKKIIDVSAQMRTTDDFELLVHTPAQALGSSRYKLPRDSEEIYEKVLNILKEYNVGYFFYNGGNDSMDTVSRLAAFFKKRGEDIVAVGIPKTIDNDLVETDHTPGFGSAARYVAASVAEVYLDTIVYPIPAVTVVEIMGRNAGWLTAASVLARRSGIKAPHLIYLPEVIFDPEDFIARTRQLLESERQIVIAVSEGIRLADGSYLADTGAAEDMFGHKTLGGVASTLETMIKERIKIEKLKTRAIQFSTLQRAAAHMASDTDLRESYECGYRAVEAALQGVTDVMITIRRASDEPYLTSYAASPLSGIANKEKKIPIEWISKDGVDVTEEMVRYLTPLVRGDATEKMRGGLPEFFKFDTSEFVDPKRLR